MRLYYINKHETAKDYFRPISDFTVHTFDVPVLKALSLTIFIRQTLVGGACYRISYTFCFLIYFVQEQNNVGNSETDRREILHDGRHGSRIGLLPFLRAVPPRDLHNPKCMKGL